MELVCDNKCYILQELRDRFDEVKRGDLTLFMRPRTGLEGTNFTNRCKVLHAPENAKFPVGDIVWVHHFLEQQKLATTEMEGAIYCREDQIWIATDRLEDLVSENFVIFNYPQKRETTTKSGLTLIENVQEDFTQGEVISGALPKGTKIEILENREYELWDNEESYLIIDIRHIVRINGELTEYYYAYKEIDTYELYKEYAMIVKRAKAVVLNNPKLKHHGAMALTTANWKQRVLVPEQILTLFEESESHS